ncbi:MAG: sulfur oxidation c-type cytochrome SoxX [Alsobacter sp.]
MAERRALPAILAGLVGFAWGPCGPPPSRAGEPVIVGDGIPEPLDARQGDAGRGRLIVASRQSGLCLLCHAAPLPEARQQGDLAPDLAHVGARYTAPQLRLRVVDSRRLNGASLMPPYFVTTGLQRVAPAYRGRPILGAQEIEDVVAFLETLK